MPTNTFPHVTDARTREILESDPATIQPCMIFHAAVEALQHAKQDLFDPEVLNAGERMEIAEEAVFEADPVKVHRALVRFWSI